MKLFRVASGDGRTDYVVTNDLAQNDTSVAQQACNWRWKIEQFHREAKQLTGIEGCQCRLARIVRNHIGCAMLVWVRLKQVAYQTDQTIYQVKQFSEHSPDIQICVQRYTSVTLRVLLRKNVLPMVHFCDPVWRDCAQQSCPCRAPS